MTERLPRTVRPLQAEYFTIAHVMHVYGDELYTCITDRQFIRACMEQSRGFMNPTRAEQIYYDLMAEAGLRPLRAYEIDEQLVEFHRMLNENVAADVLDGMMKNDDK
jgi:hypothetical protein